LAEEKWYDGAEFFFVQDNFVAVTGDPTNSTIGYPAYYCSGEESGVFDEAGLVGILSNGQFFITLGTDAAQLTGQFAMLGKVTSGMEILDALTRYSPAEAPTSPADVLETIDIVKK
jgi:cyclophilin family peptidyl-prolyl cis-trans isomerase